MPTKDELKDRVAELESSLEAAKEKLERAEFLAEALMNSPYAFGSGFPDGSLYLCNQAFCDLTGYTEQELRDMTWAVDLTPEEWRAYEAEKLAELHRTGEPQLYEKEYFHKDGSRIPIEIKTFMTTDEEGAPELYYAFLSDISERREALETWQSLFHISRDINVVENEDELLRVLAQPAVEAGADIAYLEYIDLDENGEPEWVEMVAGWRAEGELPLPVGTRLYLPEFPIAEVWFANPSQPQLIPDIQKDDQIDENTKSVYAQSGTRAIAIIPLTRSGEWIGLLNITWNTPHSFSEQEIAMYEALVGIAAPAVANRRMVDNLEQMVDERTAELRKSEILLHTFLENIPGVGVIKDREGRTLLNNRELEINSSVGRGELVGTTVFDQFPPEIAQKMWDSEAEIMDTGQASQVEEMIPRDGEMRTVLTTKFPLPGEDDHIFGLGVISIDITEQKRAEAERERLQQEVIDAQQRALQELSTPVIPVMDRILVMPLIGSVDSMRARDITRTLLHGISRHRAKVVILDVTGVPLVDSGVANHLNKTVQAARLKGARTIVTGISDAVAETIVDLGIDWSRIETLSDLQTGLIAALNSMDIKLTPENG